MRFDIKYLVDTAGIRDTKDVIEQIGVEKARNIAKDADLIIYVADASIKLDENDKEIIEYIKDKKAIVLLNKTENKYYYMPAEEPVYGAYW